MNVGTAVSSGAGLLLAAAVAGCGIPDSASVDWPPELCRLTGDVEQVNADGTRTPLGFSACRAEFRGVGFITTTDDEVDHEYSTIGFALMPEAAGGTVQKPGTGWLTLIVVLEKRTNPDAVASYPVVGGTKSVMGNFAVLAPADFNAARTAYGNWKSSSAVLEGALGTDKFSFDIGSRDGTAEDWGKISATLKFADLAVPAGSQGAGFELDGKVTIDADKPEPATTPSDGNTRFSCKAADTPGSLGVCVDYLITDETRGATFKSQCASPATLLSGNCAGAGVTGPNVCQHAEANGDTTCTYSSFSDGNCTGTGGTTVCTM